jgi:hypothetical protein
MRGEISARNRDEISAKNEKLALQNSGAEEDPAGGTQLSEPLIFKDYGMTQIWAHCCAPLHSPFDIIRQQGDGLRLI